MTTRSRTHVGRSLVLVVAFAALLGLLAVRGLGGADAAGDGAAPSASVPSVGVGASDCGDGWSGGTAGTTTLTLHNDGPGVQDVYLQEPSTRRIYLDVESLGIGASRTVSVTLAAGSYRLVCASSATGSIGGPTVEVTGTTEATLTRGVVPVTDADLIAPLGRYRAWLLSHLTRFQHRVRALRTALDRGDAAEARRRWLGTQTAYATLGGAYGAFGAFDQAIDGAAAPGIPPPGRRRDHGLPAIGDALWRGRSPHDLLPLADRLAAAVRGLREHLGTDPALAPIDLGLRAHEILEDALRTLAVPPQGPAAGVAFGATLRGDLVGTRVALGLLRPLLRDRDPRLGALDAALDRLSRAVVGLSDPLRLPRARREALDARLDDAVELLADVAVITDPVLPMPDDGSAS